MLAYLKQNKTVKIRSLTSGGVVLVATYKFLE